MNRKYLLLVLAFLLITSISVPAAYANISNGQQKAIQDIYNRISENEKQLVQEYVNAGQITKEQSELMKKRIDQANQYRINGTTNNGVDGPGFGCWGGGSGFWGNAQSGTGGFGGGWGSCW